MKNLLHTLQSKSTAISGTLFSIYLLYLSFTDKLTFYIHPDYKSLATIMSLILLLISVYGLFFYHSHFHGSKFSLERNVLLISVLVFILGTAIAPAALTSNTAVRRGVDNSSANFARSTDDIKVFSAFGQDTRTYDIGTWLKAFTYNPEPTEYIGKKVSVTGFYHKPEDVAKDLFYVSRYVITCCSVDARPVGLHVKITDKDAIFKEGDWIKVEGEFTTGKDDGKTVTVINPEKVTSEERPNNPYIY